MRNKDIGGASYKIWEVHAVSRQGAWSKYESAWSKHETSVAGVRG